MSRSSISILLLCVLSGTGAFAQSPPPAPKTLAATLKVYVYPTKGQKAEQQSADEARCYTWAVETTGIDPFLVQKQAEAGMQQAAAQQAAAAVSEAQMGDFRKAFSVCLEGKGYLAKV